MPRKAYIADVEIATNQAAAQDTPGITYVEKGSEDGELQVCFVQPSGLPIEINLIALEVGGYPSENFFMITTVSLDLPAGVNDALQDVQDSSKGMSIPDLISTISRKLQRLLAGQPEALDVGMEEVETDEEMDDDNDPFLGSDDEWQDPSTGKGPAAMKVHVKPEDALKINKRIRADLRAVRSAGFKIGILSGMEADSISSLVSISVRVDRLGLSEEATQAWDLEQQQYVVLLIRYCGRYKEFEAIIQGPAEYAQLEFKVGVSNTYKPTLIEALAAFGNNSNIADYSSEIAPESGDRKEPPATGFSSIFISGSLNRFMEQLISLVKIRHGTGLGWTDANKWFNDNQSRIANNTSEIPPPSSVDDTSSLKNLPPESLLRDHLTDVNATDISFPLIAAQFFFKYLVQCTEHCLVCHEKTQEEFQALKPYVCDKPLCLYQYMALGFGPSLEHEILTQPYVVDLLISFCYASAYSMKIRVYPTGMSLLVPPTNISSFQGVGSTNRSADVSVTTTSDQHPSLLDVKFDTGRQEILFDGTQSCPVHSGEWVALKSVGVAAVSQFTGHYQVMDTSLYPVVKLSKGTTLPNGGRVVPNGESYVVTVDSSDTPPEAAIVSAKLGIYSQNFDDIDIPFKAQSIVTLLETLPSIKEMRDYLTRQSRYSQPNLRHWKERVSPSALGLLRWIIASNRSCIVQVDKCPGQDEDDVTLAKIRPAQKILNLENSWVQFRFAQGAPDKEQRFLNALKEQQGNLNPKHPTLFAWHGSSLFNWHSIIRSGLDFKDTQHGRAYGHGVYHALDQNTSEGYSRNYSEIWPGSDLKIASAMSLNEIVNCPAQFASSSPFLVVQHIDWIQCRYMLVQVRAPNNLNEYDLVSSDQTANPTQRISDSCVQIAQDPKFTPHSTRRKPIGIPLCAATTSNLFRVGDGKDASRPQKKLKRSINSTPSGVESSSEEDEDLMFLLSDDDEQSDNKGKGISNADLMLMSSTTTGFIPGSLDQSTLPMLEPPSYATSMATKTLNRNLKEILEIQKKNKLHELGWYINPELISNVYQWIVELHSFDPATPLAQDMKEAGVTSVVLEMRFGKDYPHSPPFVRVVRPRFLPFTAGGGGHVTGGGAMCMELLTNTGWSAVSSIESVLLQVRMAMMNLEPRPARLETKVRSQQRDYVVGEAIDAYRRACMAHGWQIPPDFGEFASNGTVLANSNTI